MVWVVADQTVDGSETGTSFRQALGFMELGFKLHDTMIYHNTKPPLTHNRYEQKFEYMFVLCNDYVKTFNPIMVQHTSQRKRRWANHKNVSSAKGKAMRGREQFMLRKSNLRIKDNIWRYVHNARSCDAVAYKHPATFPEALARDHILSWSNPGDLVLDPMAGSGTVGKMALELGRRCVMIDISEEYCNIMIERLRQPSYWSLPTEAKAEPVQGELL